MMTAVACQDYMKDTFEQKTLLTKAHASISEVIDHYWYKREKIQITRSENKSFVLFRSADRLSLISSLNKLGIGVNSSKIKEYGYGGTDLSGDAAKSFLNYEWVEVDINYISATSIPEVAYAAPYYSVRDGHEFPMTNLVYVYLKNTGDITLLEKLSKEYNVGIIGKVPKIPNWYVVACTKESKGNALAIANSFYESGLFDGAQPAFISARPTCTNDYYFINQWNLENIGLWGSTYYGIDIKYHNALSLIPSSSNIVVGVVDYGIELTHPDLSVSTFSWDAYTNSSPSQIYSEHGTKMAGIIAAMTNNSIGVAGIASPVKVMSLSNDFSQSTIEAQLASSIIMAADQGASVINNSWENDTYNQGINDAIDYAVQSGRNGLGCVVIFCTGNGNLGYMRHPANYSPDSDVIAVGAISYNGQRKSYSTPDGEPWGSNYGSELDIVAPGVFIPTTTLTTGSQYVLNCNGTSAAAAHVSAVAALILSIDPSLTRQTVTYIIEKTAQKLPGYTFNYWDELGGSWNSEVGHGLLDAYAALTAASSVTRTINLGFHYNDGPSGVYADCSGYTLLPNQSQNYQVTNYTDHTITQTISVDNNYIIELEEEPRGDYIISGEGTSNLQVTYLLYTSGTVVNSLILKFTVR